MEIFLSKDIENHSVTLDEEESRHCIKVLRHKPGDEIHVIDGDGCLYRCIITSISAKSVTAKIVDTQEDWGSHPYYLTMAVCPTKNMDRYEWFLEKACEIGIDEIVPIIGEHSERRIFKTQRAEKILISATKQSLKARVPRITAPIPVSSFITATSHPAASAVSSALSSSESAADTSASPSASVTGPSPEPSTDFPADSTSQRIDYQDIKLIACCFEDETHPRISITEALSKLSPALPTAPAASTAPAAPSSALPSTLIGPSSPATSAAYCAGKASGKRCRITIMIGPEGDFSEKEVALAIKHGFIPVHLGPSRLRTETAALFAVSAAYIQTGVSQTPMD